MELIWVWGCWSGRWRLRREEGNEEIWFAQNMFDEMPLWDFDHISDGVRSDLLRFPVLLVGLGGSVALKMMILELFET